MPKLYTQKYTDFKEDEWSLISNNPVIFECLKDGSIIKITDTEDKIWEILRTFDKAETYQSMTTKTELDGQGVGSQRTVTAVIPDGNTIKLVEKLDYLNDDEKTMKISIVDGPLPLNSAVVTIKVGALEDNKTELEFDSIFDPKPGAEEELKKGFQFVFQDSAKGLEKLVS